MSPRSKPYLVLSEDQGPTKEPVLYGFFEAAPHVPFRISQRFEAVLPPQRGRLMGL